MKQYIPNTVTLINLFLGCLSVALALRGDVVSAGILIVVCSLLDFLDGFLARVLKAGSLLGQQLDSLADLVSFGMAPGAIFFVYLENASAGSALMEYTPYLGFLIPVFSALRLAIFNTDTRQTSSFIGLPTPANALLLASFPLVMEFGRDSGAVYQLLESAISQTWVIIAIVLVSCGLLVSSIGMFSLKLKSLKWSDNQVRYIFLAGSIFLLALFQINSIPLILIFYIILSTIQHLFFQTR